MALKTICTSNCENCIHCTIEEINKATIYINCDDKHKRIEYGQIIQCDNFKKKEN